MRAQHQANGTEENIRNSLVGTGSEAPIPFEPALWFIFADMCLVLVNLDTGLFCIPGGWTTDPALAQNFPDHDAVEAAARNHDLKHAAAALIDDEKQIRGFWWIST